MLSSQTLMRSGGVWRHSMVSRVIQGGSLTFRRRGITVGFLDGRGLLLGRFLKFLCRLSGALKRNNLSLVYVHEISSSGLLDLFAFGGGESSSLVSILFWFSCWIQGFIPARIHFFPLVFFSPWGHALLGPFKVQWLKSFVFPRLTLGEGGGSGLGWGYSSVGAWEIPEPTWSGWTQSLWPEGRRLPVVWGSPHLFPGPKAVACFQDPRLLPKEVEHFQGRAHTPVSRSLFGRMSRVNSWGSVRFRRHLLPGTVRLPVVLQGEGFCSGPPTHHRLPGVTFHSREGCLKGTSLSLSSFILSFLQTRSLSWRMCWQKMIFCRKSHQDTPGNERE